MTTTPLPNRGENTPTPRTDKAAFDDSYGYKNLVDADFARTLERESAALALRVQELEALVLSAAEAHTMCAALCREKESLSACVQELESGRAGFRPRLTVEARIFGRYHATTPPVPSHWSPDETLSLAFWVPARTYRFPRLARLWCWLFPSAELRREVAFWKEQFAVKQERYVHVDYLDAANLKIKKLEAKIASRPEPAA